MSNYILTAENIQKEYGKNKILNDVSINIKGGEIYGLVGKNGSGKTTLLSILTGLIQRYSGTVSIGKIDNRKSKVSTVINSPSLFLNLNSFENMKGKAYLLGMNDDSTIKQTLKTVGLEESMNKLVKDFSLGMTQRLRLAMALLENPDILILDEPVNGLDPEGIVDLRELLLRLNTISGMTILISSHILSELEQIATCFGILHNGRIIKEVFAKEVLQNGETLEELYIKYTKGGQ